MARYPESHVHIRVELCRDANIVRDFISKRRCHVAVKMYSVPHFSVSAIIHQRIRRYFGRKFVNFKLCKLS